MSKSDLMPIPQNFKKNVDWILGAYTDADVTFPNGFQFFFNFFFAYEPLCCIIKKSKTAKEGKPPWMLN